MNNFGKTLRAIRISRGMSQEKMAELLGTSKQVISRYETGQRRPTITVAADYAERLGITLTELNGGTKPTNVVNNILPITRRKVPMLGTIAAGQPIYADEEYDAYVVDGSDTPCDFALRVSGDSMEPRFLDGDIVFFRSQDDVLDGQIAAVIIDDTATLKHVYHMKSGVQLVSDNSKYPPMIFDASNSSSVRILGLAVGYYRCLG